MRAVAGVWFSPALLPRYRRRTKVSPGEARYCPGPWLPLFGALLASLSSLSGAASGQSVHGQLVEVGSGSPVEGALAVLLTVDGREVDGALTDRAGRFRLRAMIPGRYFVHAERIGFETASSPVLQLSRSEIRGIRLETRASPIELDEIRIEGERRCVVRPSEGLQMAQLWEEARKVLRVQDWIEAEGLYEYLVSNYTRTIDPTTGVVVSESRETDRRLAKIPIRSRSVEDLIENGFIRDMGDGSYEYNGPDASVLLSDLFLDTHCFRLKAEEDRPNSLGLSFEPVGSARTPDIRGTLWLDATTAELQSLEFGYTWSAYPEAEGVARGRIEFEGLPNGVWIVRDWWIRMPTVVPYRSPLDPGATRFKVGALTEAGGEVRQVFSIDHPVMEEKELGLITGFVWDSIRGTPLDSATVYLSGTSHATLSDSLGRFKLDDVPPGVFGIAFSHPRIDSLGVFLPASEVESRPGGKSEVSLGLPSFETILAAGCTRAERGGSSSAIVGRVTVTGTGDPVAGASVLGRWRPAAGRDEANPQAFHVLSNTEGYFRICSVPPGQGDLEIGASFLDQKSDTRTLRPRPDSHEVVNLELGLSRDLISPSGSSPGVAGSSGRQGVRGRVLDARTRDPIPNVELILRGGSLGPPLTDVTDRSGAFRFDPERAGTFTLTASGLGYGEAGPDSLFVPAGQTILVRIEIAPEPLHLEPLVVVAESRPYHLELHGFYERADRGFGHFLRPQEIQERKPNDIADLLRGVPGLRLSESSEFGTAILVSRPGLGSQDRRTGTRAFCEPRLYVDGVQISQPRPRNEEGHLGVYPDQVVQVRDIAAVEVHLRSSSLPLAFGGTQEGCGAILIWTKR